MRRYRTVMTKSSGGTASARSSAGAAAQPAPATSTENIAPAASVVARVAAQQALLSRAEKLTHQAPPHGNPRNAKNHQVHDRGRGALSRQRLRAEEPPCDDRIRRIVSQLEASCPK